jgi:hypothetical protein
MEKSTQSNFTGDKSIEQAVRVFSYFDLILNQLKTDSKESFSHALSIFKKISENLKDENVLISNLPESSSDDLFTKSFAINRVRLNEIIILLQFEDILNQKFDHISQINQIVIDVLQHNKELTIENKLLLLKKIILLNSAQLEYIKDEFEAICKDLKSKLEDIYKASENILLAVRQSVEENTRQSNFPASINSSMVLIRSFIDTDIVKLSMKVDAIINIFEGWDFNTASSHGEKMKEFDMHQLLKIYTIDSERIVFKKVFAGGDWTLSDDKPTSSSDVENIHLF